MSPERLEPLPAGRALSRRSSAAALRVIRQWQSPTEELRHAPDSIGIRLAVWTLGAALAAALAATPFVPVDRVVSSSAGEIVSTAPLNTFQALDPSIVRRIDVKEGQEVKAGQLLATLDPTVAQADVAQLRQQVAGLDAEIARTRSERAGGPFEIPTSLPAGALPYWTLQRSLFDQRAASLVAQLKSFDEKIGTANATLAKLQGDTARYAERDQILKQIEDMRSTLYKSGASSLVSLLEANDARLQLLQQLDDGHNSLVEAQHQLASQQADREAFLQGWRVGIDQELVTALNARDTATAALEKANRHEDLVRLTAPEDAVVLSVAELSGGSVLKQGDEILKLAPLDAPVEAEIHLPAREIGFVRAGDPAAIKIDSYASYEHGAGEGHLGWISEGAFTESDNGQPLTPFYKARVQIDRLDFRDLPKGFRLIPGMTLTTDVKVGTRSVFAYVLGGFTRGTGEPMRGP